MTLAQIWQIGEKIGDIEEINIEGEFNPYQKVFSMFKDVKKRKRNHTNYSFPFQTDEKDIWKIHPQTYDNEEIQ